MSLPTKASVSLRYKTGDFCQVTISTDKDVKPAYRATGWFSPPQDFPELSVDIPSKQTSLIIMDTEKPPKGLEGLYVSFDRPNKNPEKFPVNVLLSFNNGSPGLDSTTATFSTSREKIEGPLDKCPKFSALGYVIWK